MFTRIQWRIAASYVALIALVFLALGVYLVGYLHQQQLARLETELQRQASLVANSVQERLATAGRADLDPLAKRLGRAIGARITLIAVDGTVLGDSDHDPATMDNHASRPEVVQALETGSGRSQRHSVTLEQDLLYVAVPIVHNGDVLGVARVALPVREVQGAQNQVAQAVALALLGAALLAVALAGVVARVTTQPIQALTHAAQQLAGGALHYPVPVAGRDEVGLLARVFDEMASALKRQIQALEDERGRLAGIVHHMADGLIIADQQGQVLLINPVAARLLQIDQAQAEGRSVMTLVRDHELAALIASAISRDGTDIQPRLVELGLPGQRHAIHAVVSQIPHGDGGAPHVLLMLQDVTELRRAETMRREFVANVSHELRTPVASLKVLAETLLGGALDDAAVARDFLERMQVEVDRLAQLVEELLDLSRIESGQNMLHIQPIALGVVVQVAAERLRPLAGRYGLDLAIQIPNDLPLIQADPEQIQRVVINLVHNAVKFTPPGGRVRVSVEHRESEVAIAVSDTGIGIAPEALPRLFERFYKADRSRAGGGTGLGLAIAKHLVQAHGGRIWAESDGAGEGATFVVTLPLAPVSSRV